MTNLNNFKTRLKIAKEKLKSGSENIDNNGNNSSMGSAFKLSTDLVAHVAVGTIIGFILDLSLIHI